MSPNSLAFEKLGFQFCKDVNMIFDVDLIYINLNFTISSAPVPSTSAPVAAATPAPSIGTPFPLRPLDFLRRGRWQILGKIRLRNLREIQSCFKRECDVNSHLRGS